MKIAIIQSDDRYILEKTISKKLIFDENKDDSEMIRSLNGSLLNDWNYWSIVCSINKLKTKHLGYDYFFSVVEKKDFADYNSAWLKVPIILNFLNNNNHDIVIYLDTDAWIRDHHGLDQIINYFYKSEKQGMFSRDPKLSKNTYINTGVQVWKNNNYCKDVLNKTIEFMKNNSNLANKWPYEQKPISDFVESNKKDFIICKVNVLNTPCGEIIRHCWNKSLIQELLIDESLSCLLINEKKYKNLEITSLFELY